jgi:hypothetical protein
MTDTMMKRGQNSHTILAEVKFPLLPVTGNFVFSENEYNLCFVGPCVGLVDLCLQSGAQITAAFIFAR